VPAEAEDEIAAAARRLFGVESLRPGQREAVEAAVAGQDVLAIMATGAGKSAVFALAGVLRGGLTLVVSPLLALQRDQSQPLEAAGLRVCVLNSDVAAGEFQHRLESIRSREADFAYVAPEQMVSPEVVDALRAAATNLLVVDEAHLVSQWGQDFRPDYLRIATVAEAIGRPPILALTATAAPPVRDDIVERLRLEQPRLMVRGFDRPNISLCVRRYLQADRDKLEALRDDVLEAVRETGSGIVYAATRRGVEGLAADWRERGVAAVAYHAGLSKSRRLAIEAGFREGRCDVIVATVAFGMGIDKPDVRWVYHADLPPSIDAYYQEFGRAGRDGEPARAVLYYRPEDMRLPRMFASRSGPSAKTLRATAGAVAGGARTLGEVAASVGLAERTVSGALQTLGTVGALTLDASGRIDAGEDLGADLDRALELIAQRRTIERTRVDTMAAYAETRGCRRQFILEYFGEPAEGPCGNCDNDDASAPGGGRDAAGANGRDDREKPFAHGTPVEHETFGPGQVVGYSGGDILVSFDDAGYRRLSLELVEEHDLLASRDQADGDAG
jgi:ATP-dependent DNA helicase RecQ